MGGVRNFSQRAEDLSLDITGKSTAQPQIKCPVPPESLSPLPVKT